MDILYSVHTLLYHTFSFLSSIFLSAPKNPNISIACGLVGMAGDLSYQARQLMRDLLEVSGSRGRDSAGVIKVKKDLDYDWYKMVGSPTYLCESRPYERRIEAGDAVALIGHTRSKTVGEVNTKNAHPFDFPGKVCGVHNGTLRNYYSLDGHKNGMVDSEVLYAHLAENGPQDTFEKAEGAYACVWWDAANLRLNFIRNSERPLWFTWSKDLRMMFWASERWMFSVIARKIDMWEGDEKKDRYIELPPHKLWSFELRPKALTKESPLMLQPVLTIEPKPKATTFHRNFHEENFEDDGWVKTKEGTWVREKTFGGEVANPFLAGLRRQLTGDEELDDQIPWGEMQERVRALREERVRSTPTLVGLKNSRPSNVHSLTKSADVSVSPTALSITKPLERAVLSLPARNSPNSRLSNSAGSSNGFGKRSEKSESFSQGVSLRTVAGMKYVTDNKTGKEYVEKDFMEATGGACTFCKTPSKTLYSIGAILNDKTFLCKACQNAEEVN